MPICTQGMQRTWWPEASTIIVTGLYCWWWLLCSFKKLCYENKKNAYWSVFKSFWVNQPIQDRILFCICYWIWYSLYNLFVIYIASVLRCIYTPMVMYRWLIFYSLSPDWCVDDFESVIFKHIYELISWMLSVWLLSGECNNITLVISQY